jgi:cysteine desulfurase family protein (TIGR01976 family)
MAEDMIAAPESRRQKMEILRKVDYAVKDSQIIPTPVTQKDEPNAHTATGFSLRWVRNQFPALTQTVAGTPVAFFDGPGGTQVPQTVIDSISHYLSTSNANLDGHYPTSMRTNAVVHDARRGMADLLNCDEDEIVLGANMTTLTLAMSRSISRELGPGDEVVLTRLDHDANFAPWRLLEETGATIRVVDVRTDTCTLDLEDLASKITHRTKLVAVGLSSNLVGTITDVAHVVRLARSFGALTYVDAVHHAPHHLIDVRALDCDFLVCSSYKFFGPHMGILYGRRELLGRLRPYKLRASSDAVPDRWNTGTLNHECAAAIPSCLDYLAAIGRQVEPAAVSRRMALSAAYNVIEAHENELFGQLIRGLWSIPSLTIYGVTDPEGLADRSPTCAFTVKGISAAQIATRLGEQNIFVGSGHFYALNLAEALGVAKSGVVRIGIMHYNTADEIERVTAALRHLVTE